MMKWGFLVILINFMRMSGIWIVSGGLAGIAAMILIATWTLCRKGPQKSVSAEKYGISPKSFTSHLKPNGSKMLLTCVLLDSIRRFTV